MIKSKVLLTMDSHICALQSAIILMLEELYWDIIGYIVTLNTAATILL